MRGRWKVAALGALAMTLVVHCGGVDESPPPASPEEAGAPPSVRPDASVDSAPPAPPPFYGSGSRFEAVETETSFADGTKTRQFAGAFFDTRNHDICQIGAVGPNEFGCLSIHWTSAYDGDSYSDPSCTQPVLALLSASPTDDAKYVRIGCPPKIADVGPIKYDTIFYRKNPLTQACEIAHTSAATMPVPTILPPSTFGTFTRKTDTRVFPAEQSGTRLIAVADRFDSDDGAFEVRAPRIVDLARGMAGSVAFGSDMRRHLFTGLGPIYPPSTLTFADATCTTATLSFPRDYTSCHEDPYRPKDGLKVETSPDGACAMTRAFSRPASPPLVHPYEGPASSCRLDLIPAAGRDLYPEQALAEVPVTSFVEVNARVVPNDIGVTAGTELEARSVAYSSADGLDLRERTWSLYLRKYDVECRVQPVSGETSRCLPNAAVTDLGGGVSYSDAACTKGFRRLLIRRRTCTGEPTPAVYRDVDQATGAPRFLKSAAVTKLPARYERNAAGECVPAADDGAAYAPLTNPDEVPISEFPAVTGTRSLIGGK